MKPSSWSLIWRICIHWHPAPNGWKMLWNPTPSVPSYFSSAPRRISWYTNIHPLHDPYAVSSFQTAFLFIFRVFHHAIQSDAACKHVEEQATRMALALQAEYWVLNEGHIPSVIVLPIITKTVSPFLERFLQDGFQRGQLLPPGRGIDFQHFRPRGLHPRQGANEQRHWSRAAHK